MSKPLGNSVVEKQPWIEVRNTIETIGVRKVISTKIVASEISRALASVKRAMTSVGREHLDRPFFRFHSIAMGVTYDIEVGYTLTDPVPVVPGLISSRFEQGTYACLQYLGKGRGYQGNKALLDWIHLSGYHTDNWDSELGDSFACRYELYLSDIESEPDNTKWLKEVAIKLKD